MAELSSQGTEVNKNSTSCTSVVSPQKKKKKKKRKRKKRKIKKGSGARLVRDVQWKIWLKLKCYGVSQ